MTDQPTDHGGLPLNNLDKLRSIALCRRAGMADERARRALQLSPDAYDFASGLLLALAAADLLHVLGPLGPDPVDE